MALKNENPNLFHAVNALKSKSFIYGRGSEENIYNCLISCREDVNEILSYDNCEMRLNSDLQMVKIHFLDAEDEEPAKTENLLKAKFNANDMKVFVACLTLYNEKFYSLGAYVDIVVANIIDCLDNLQLVVGSRRKGGGSIKAEIDKSLLKLDRFGMLDYRKRAGSILLKPGLIMGIDRETFNDTYEELLSTWKDIEDDSTSAEEDEDGRDANL